MFIWFVRLYKDIYKKTDLVNEINKENDEMSGAEARNDSVLTLKRSKREFLTPFSQ